MSLTNVNDSQQVKSNGVKQNDTLQQKLQLYEAENCHLVAQNHKLLEQLEAAGYQLHQANTRVSLVAVLELNTRWHCES